MKKVINIRNYIIVILCITIICLGIGFIVLSVSFNNYKNTKSTYDVSFVEVSKLTSVSGGKNEPQGDIKVVDKAQELDMNFTLNNARDELVYNVTIRNNGTMPVEIVKLIESPPYTSSMKNYILPLSINISDVSGKIMNPGDSLDVKIDVLYNYSTIKGTKSFNYNLGILARSAYE